MSTTNGILFTSPKQAAKIKHLEEEMRFRRRVMHEAEARWHEAKQLMAAAIDELGVPVDGRTIHIEYEDWAQGNAGVYWESFELALDTKQNPPHNVLVKRTRAQGLAWAGEMAKRGHPVEIPGEPPLPDAPLSEQRGGGDPPEQSLHP